MRADIDSNAALEDRCTERRVMPVAKATYADSEDM